MRAGEVYSNPASGERGVVILGTHETGGKRIVIDLYLRPGGGMIERHYHPTIHERFKVIQGEVSYTLNGVEASAQPGQTVDIPPGTLFICKRRGGPRIGAPHQIPFGNAISADSAQTVVSGCPDRAMLPKTPVLRAVWNLTLYAGVY